MVIRDAAGSTRNGGCHADRLSRIIRIKCSTVAEAAAHSAIGVGKLW